MALVVFLLACGGCGGGGTGGTGGAAAGGGAGTSGGGLAGSTGAAGSGRAGSTGAAGSGHAGSTGAAGGALAGGSGAGGAGAFTPAVQPADICSLLSLADVQAILPTAGAGVAQPATTVTASIWSVECDWKDPTQASKSVALIVYGALTSQATQGLDETMQSLGSGNTTATMALTGVGDAAEYVNLTGYKQLIDARTGSYLVDVTASFVSPDVTAAQLQPLVVKAIGGL